ncbi:MAG: hypothetical protein IPH35_03715 [Rhodoferax sp.]|nr:hypothetical protein [Rhodoferax sp.]
MFFAKTAPQTNALVQTRHAKELQIKRLWDNCDAPVYEVLEALPDWDQAAQPEPDDCADQRIHW